MSKINLIKNYHTKIANSDVHLCSINGAECGSLEDFYKAITLGLELPDYFAYNLDSLEELLTDLSWISESAVILFIYNSKELLSSDNEKREMLLSLFSDINGEPLDIVLSD